MVGRIIKILDKDTDHTRYMIHLRKVGKNSDDEVFSVLTISEKTDYENLKKNIELLYHFLLK